MLDIQFIRANPDKVKKACKDKGVDERIVDTLIKVDRICRTHIKLVEEKRQELNKATDLIKKEKDDKKRLNLIAHAQKIKRELRNLEPQLKKNKKDYQNLILQIPNPPADDVKSGKDESENEVIKTWGKKPEFDFKVKDHFELGEKLDLIDVKRASKVSGTRFGYLKKDAVLLEFALIQYGLENFLF